jgi:23S rRNA (uracil1939-C5)-methyltransferase
MPLGSRRRATFALGRTPQGLVFGYRRARSHDLIDIDTCPILSPAIVSRLPKLKAVLGSLLGGKREVRVAVTGTETGLDVVVEGVRPKEAVLAKLASEAARLGVARVTVGGESLMPGAPPTVRFGASQVKLPPGAFLQASPDAEQTMVELGERRRRTRQAHRRSVCRPRHIHPRACRQRRRRCLRGRRDGPRGARRSRAAIRRS